MNDLKEEKQVVGRQTYQVSNVEISFFHFLKDNLW